MAVLSIYDKAETRERLEPREALQVSILYCTSPHGSSRRRWHDDRKCDYWLAGGDKL